MTDLKTNERRPDILEVISDLSNDEVFTPPAVANAMLDLLPAEVWTDPTLRWLDPGAKTGVFPREITRRLLDGLAKEIPDEDERLRHILTNMVFGIAITELTAQISRRSVYCSKDASSQHSVVKMSTGAGNIWFNRVEHSYTNGRCRECGASEEQMEKVNRDNHAYAFIHKTGREAVEGDMSMKFDVIVGNPPYQMTGGGGGTNDTPLYHYFVQQAKALNPSHIVMVTPSRWLAGGRGLGPFRAEMLADKQLRTLVDFPNSNEIFPGRDIKSGVAYFHWQAGTKGECDVTVIREDDRETQKRSLDEFDVFVRDEKAVTILRKVLAYKEESVIDIMSGDTPFGLATNFDGYHLKESEGDVKLHAIRKQRLEAWMPRDLVPRGHNLIGGWKVLVPKAGSDGGQKIPDVVLGRPLVAGPNSCCTQSYLVAGPFSTKKAATSFDSYTRTRFFRFLVSLRKITQDALRSTYTWVPQQSWDKTWTDAELYKKYDITAGEQAYIESMVKEMPA